MDYALDSKLARFARRIKPAKKKKRLAPPSPFKQYKEGLPDDKAEQLREFFEDFSAHCLIAKKEKKRLQTDFERAILHYENAGVSLEKALDLLAVKNLGSFYARPPVLWFPLDDAAKIYPLSMEHGIMSIFRLSVYLKQSVVPELLQMALNFTIKRFPSFATTLKKGFFWHYLDTTKRRFTVEQEKGVPCESLKVALSGSQSFRVIYYENRISVEFFHVLTDGYGGMAFLMALTSEYLRLMGVEIEPEGMLWDVNAIPVAEEVENAFAKVPRSGSASGFMDKLAVQMNGKLSENKPSRVIHFKMNASELKAVAKKHHTTITVYLLTLMFLAGRAATDELQGEASIQVPVNMRKFYPSKTVRNFSMYCGIRMPIEETTDVQSIIVKVDEQLQKKASKESMDAMLMATVRLVKFLKYIPLILKQRVAKVVYGFLGDKIFTNTLSNLGVINVPPAMAEHIESMDTVMGPPITNRASCSVITMNDIATFSITKTTFDPTFEEAMYDLLLADGISITVEGSDFYEA
jgi:hypothetical protein